MEDRTRVTFWLVADSATTPQAQAFNLVFFSNIAILIFVAPMTIKEFARLGMSTTLPPQADDDVGIAKVLSGNFPYITESAISDKAIAANPGKLARAGGTLAQLYLALAVQQGSPLREKLNTAFVKLQELGVVDDLIRKYVV
ncbi:hypothetical protein BV898_02996 [Hypsibius exemplaris]|uniref:Uncharacterized protein n=1 Tax=Hypsibius exemplaris TaxID=2072580 RepID=A0A1W0X6C4_HYPEX|nr:hypothetical protein BV898_02996 [Hypsibius exemplaris]